MPFFVALTSKTTNKKTIPLLFCCNLTPSNKATVKACQDNVFIEQPHHTLVQSMWEACAQVSLNIYKVILTTFSRKLGNYNQTTCHPNVVFRLFFTWKQLVVWKTSSSSFGVTGGNLLGKNVFQNLMAALKEKSCVEIFFSWIDWYINSVGDHTNMVKNTTYGISLYW